MGSLQLPLGEVPTAAAPQFCAGTTRTKARHAENTYIALIRGQRQKMDSLTYTLPVVSSNRGKKPMNFQPTTLACFAYLLGK